jgi:flagellar hook-associated protein 1
MALFNLLSIARSALTTHQQAIEAAGHNIANANTEGYTRQRAIVQAETPVRTSLGWLGNGVRLEYMQRERNAFLDARYREEVGLGERNTTLSRYLSQIDGVFGEPSDAGLRGSLDAFWSAWGDLANDPSNSALREIVQRRGREVANVFQRLDQRFTDIPQLAQQELAGRVEDVNTLAGEIANLNGLIAQAEATGGTANDLKDRRDLAIDQLAKLVTIRVVEREGGQQAILAGDALLVDKGRALTLSVTQDASGKVAIGVTGGLGVVEPNSGEVSALLNVINDQLPEVRAQLNELAHALVTEINAIHQSGVTASGAFGVDFFDPTGVSANSIKLASSVDRSPNEIATGTTGAPGDGSVALSIAGLRTAGVASLDGISIQERYTRMVTMVGARVADTERLSSAQDVVVTNLESQRSSVHEVSVDEEMVGLITHQQAYAAAARMVAVADEMVRDLLQMV